MESEANDSEPSESRTLYKPFNVASDVGKIEIVSDHPLSIDSGNVRRNEQFGVKRNSKQYYTEKKHKSPRAIWEHTQLKRHSQQMTCPNCLSLVETSVRRYIVCVTHIVALTLVPFCMCALPYHTPVFKDTVHYCPNCHIYLGTCFAAGKKMSVFCMRPRKCEEDI